MFQKKIFGVLILLTAGMLTSCGQAQDTDNQKVQVYESNSQGEEAVEELVNTKERFGENCIPEQTFEVELSEYEGKVYFVSLAPEEEKSEFHMQIIQNNKVLTEIQAYVPSGLEGEKFTSLDSVSFYDVNYDNNTDIVLIETYGDTSFAAIYYGFATDGCFVPQEQLSETITSQVEQLSISEIRKLMSDGKRMAVLEAFRKRMKW